MTEGYRKYHTVTMVDDKKLYFRQGATAKTPVGMLEGQWFVVESFKADHHGVEIKHDGTRLWIPVHNVLSVQTDTLSADLR